MTRLRDLWWWSHVSGRTPWVWLLDLAAVLAIVAAVVGLIVALTLVLTPPVRSVQFHLELGSASRSHFGASD